MELSDRKKKVLRSVVDLYIRTAEPVGSKAITELPDMKYSSATIRNEMAELTALGYLEQPHTSAGRIPSAAGYRLYVDELMMDYRLSIDETKSINNAIEEKMQRVDKMVEMGLTEEVKAARKQGLTATAAQAIGCKELYSWLDGKETQEEALEKLKQSTRRYAKRQLTWFGTDQRMRWIEPDTLAAGETPLDKAMEILEKEGMA